MKDTAMESRKRYPSIDGLRAFAALGIVMMHMSSRFNNKYELDGYVALTVIPWFTEFVFLFMMISAFGMCCAYHERILTGSIDLTFFYRKRFMRVLPYFAFLVILDLLSDFSFERLLEGLAEVSLVFGFLPKTTKFTVMGISWFIGVIFVFYALFPLFCVLTRTKTAALRTMTAAVFYNFACHYYFLNREQFSGGYYERQNILFCAMFFVMGGLIYLYREDICEKLAGRWWIFWIFSAAVTITYFVLPVIRKNRYLKHPYLAIIFATWLIGAIIHDFEYTYLPGRIIKLLAKYSMEIYLTHMMVFRALQMTGLNYVFGRGYVSYIFTVTCSVAGSVLIAVLFHLTFDRIVRAYAGSHDDHMNL